MIGITISNMTETEAQEQDYLEISRLNETTQTWETFRVSAGDLAGLAGGDEPMPNEVRLFVGSVPEGWEKIKTQANRLPESMLETLTGLPGTYDVAVPIKSVYSPLRGRVYGPSSRTSTSGGPANYLRANEATVEGVSPVREDITSVGYAGSRPMLNAAEDRVYRVSSHSGSSTADRLDVVDLDTGVVTVLASLPVGSNDGDGENLVRVSQEVSGTFYVATGTSIQRYTIASNAWDIIPPRPSGLGGGYLTILSDGTLLAAGGYTDSSVLQATAEIFDPISETWSTGGSLAALPEFSSLASNAVRDTQGRHYFPELGMNKR